MKPKDFAVAVQYGNFMMHFQSFHEDRVDAEREAQRVRMSLAGKKKLTGPRKPHVTVWRMLTQP